MQQIEWIPHASDGKGVARRAWKTFTRILLQHLGGSVDDNTFYCPEVTDRPWSRGVLLNLVCHLRNLGISTMFELEINCMIVTKGLMVHVVLSPLTRLVWL